RHAPHFCPCDLTPSSRIGYPLSYMLKVRFRRVNRFHRFSKELSRNRIKAFIKTPQKKKGRLYRPFQAVDKGGESDFPSTPCRGQVARRIVASRLRAFERPDPEKPFPPTVEHAFGLTPTAPPGPAPARPSPSASRGRSNGLGADGWRRGTKRCKSDR